MVCAFLLAYQRGQECMTLLRQQFLAVETSSQDKIMFSSHCLPAPYNNRPFAVEQPRRKSSDRFYEIGVTKTADSDVSPSLTIIPRKSTIPTIAASGRRISSMLCPRSSIGHLRRMKWQAVSKQTQLPYSKSFKSAYSGTPPTGTALCCSRH